MLRLRVNEAIARAQSKGNKVLKQDLAAKLWGSSSTTSQKVNMTNLCTGVTKKISVEWVVVLCETLNCSADFLFGLSEDE